ncbi:hypothetical protein CK203_068361 [Vitis vinifera]|uniref:Uncharacterized protein n=1 Tax=Vitis vinifera TaxID=29760 RepID=A0A438F329_VITVI|nr:hypothetical protein CK203_068361 [Vitis vinifera]
MSVFSSSFRFLHLSDSQHDVAFTNQCSGSSAITKSPNLHFTNALHVPASSHSLSRNQVLVTRCAGAESPAKPVTDVEASFAPKIEDNNSGDGSDGSDFGVVAVVVAAAAETAERIIVEKRSLDGY